MSRKFRAETPYVVNFGFDSDALDAEAKRELDIQADWIIDHPHVKFRVYGHTDKVGNLAYNTDLGLRRAERVVAYLISKGISEDRLETMASFGEELPVIETEARERANRRTLTDVIGFVRPLDTANESEGGPVLETRTEIDIAPPVRDDDTGQPPSSTNTTTSTSTASSAKSPNSGRGNGDEAGDPGKSGGKNNGGDEVS